MHACVHLRDNDNHQFKIQDRNYLISKTMHCYLQLEEPKGDENEKLRRKIQIIIIAGIKKRKITRL